MKQLNIGQTVQIVANLGVIAGIIFLAIEIRTNTRANEILIFQGSSANWMEINGQLATSRELAQLLDKALSNQPLDSVEQRQFEGWVRQQLTHAAFIRRLSEGDLLSDEELNSELRDIRRLSDNPAFRGVVDQLVPESPFKDLIFQR